jgi:hypothetical protein
LLALVVVYRAVQFFVCLLKNTRLHCINRALTFRIASL